jgi:AcrR family transcriptional regulator
MNASSGGARSQQGEQTRNRIVNCAMNVASRQGLDALSIGELAKELGMSKSGLFAHFGSKEELQIATIQAAEATFSRAIVHPAKEQPAGLSQLRALLVNYLRYLENCVFPGGCFFSAVSAEFDDRPGRVRDRIALSERKWRALLEAQARTAQEKGELIDGADPVQLVFELKAFVHEANFNRRLLDDADGIQNAWRAIENRLLTSASATGRTALESALS